MWAVSGCCEEIRLSDLIFSDIVATERKLESMWVTRFLSGLPSSFDGARTQILGAKELPSLSEVFSHLCQDTLPSAAPSPTDRPTLAAFVESSRPSRPYHPCGFCRGRSNRPGNDDPRDSRGFSHGGHDLG